MTPDRGSEDGVDATIRLACMSVEVCAVGDEEGAESDEALSLILGREARGGAG